MTTPTEDRKSPFTEVSEDVPFSELEDTPTNLAPGTPLTREAVIHVRAAAMEIDGTIATARTILRTVDEALAGPSGGDKVLSEERRMDLARLLGEAEKMTGGAVCAVFERGRGERPHGDRPHLSLDEEEVRELALNLDRIGAAACKGDDTTVHEEQLRDAMEAIGCLKRKIVEELFERAGMQVSGEERDAMYDAAAPWGDRAAKLGCDAVESEEETS